MRESGSPVYPDPTPGVPTPPERESQEQLPLCEYDFRDWGSLIAANQELGQLFTNVGEKLEQGVELTEEEKEQYVKFLNSCIRGAEIRDIIDQQRTEEYPINDLTKYPPYWNIAKGFCNSQQFIEVESTLGIKIDAEDIFGVLIGSVLLVKSEKDVKSWGNRTYQNFYFSLRLFNNYLEEVWEQQKIEEAAGISKI